MSAYFNRIVNWLFHLSQAEFLAVVLIVLAIGVFCMRGTGLKRN